MFWRPHYTSTLCLKPTAATGCVTVVGGIIFCEKQQPLKDSQHSKTFSDKNGRIETHSLICVTFS